MSKSNASAKSRRAFIDSSKQPGQFNPSIPSSNSLSSPTTSSQPSSGLTLQQVISVIDKRLIHLETFVKEETNKKNNSDDNEENEENDNKNNVLDDIILEYNSRFSLLAEEISNIKDTLLKLQTYTMSVNKMLLEEKTNNSFELGPVTQETSSMALEDVNIIENNFEKSNENEKSENIDNISYDNKNIFSNKELPIEPVIIDKNDNLGIKINGNNFKKNRNNK